MFALTFLEFVDKNSEGLWVLAIVLICALSSAFHTFFKAISSFPDDEYDL